MIHYHQLSINLAFLKDWALSAGFHGCMFINACAEYSDEKSSPYLIAKQHKTEVRQCLLDKFEQVSAENAKQQSDTVFGEGLIVTTQTSQQSLNLDSNFLRIFT